MASSAATAGQTLDALHSMPTEEFFEMMDTEPETSTQAEAGEASASRQSTIPFPDDDESSTASRKRSRPDDAAGAAAPSAKRRRRNADSPRLNRTRSTWVTTDETLASPAAAIEEDYEVDYSPKGALGVPGTFGQVRKCKHKLTGAQRAVKIISKRAYFGVSRKQRQQAYDDLRNEIEVMRLVDHTNCVKLYDVYELENTLYLVMELCSGGDLFDYIANSDDGFTEEEAKSLIHQVLEGLEHIHRKGLLHGDMKPENLCMAKKPVPAKFRKKSDGSFMDVESWNIMTRSNPELFEQLPAGDALKQEWEFIPGKKNVKIIDFGFATHDGREWNTRTVGTLSYVARDVLQGKYSQAADLWSVGVILYVILFGFPPFHCSDKEAKEHLSKKISDEKGPFKKGDRVQVNYKGKGRWYPATVAGPDKKGRPDWLSVFYDDTPHKPLGAGLGYIRRPPVRRRLKPHERKKAQDEVVKAKIITGFDPTVKSGYGPWFPKEMCISAEARDLIGSLLHNDPAKRPSCREALCHPWFRENKAISSLQLKSFKAFKKHHQNNQDKSRFFEACVRFSYQTASHMTESQNESLRKSFEEMDQDGNGQIDWDEFCAGMKKHTSIGDESELRGMFEQLDTDKSGTLGIDEMAIAMEEQMLLSRKERLLKIFEKLDENGDRRLSREELEKGLSQIVGLEVNVEEIMEEADEDGDGYIDWNEFIDVMSPKMAPSGVLSTSG